MLIILADAGGVVPATAAFLAACLADPDLELRKFLPWHAFEVFGDGDLRHDEQGGQFVSHLVEQGREIAFRRQFDMSIKGMADQLFDPGIFENLGDIAAQGQQLFVFSFEFRVDQALFELRKTSQVDALFPLTGQEAPDFFRGEGEDRCHDPGQGVEDAVHCRLGTAPGQAAGRCRIQAIFEHIEVEGTHVDTTEIVDGVVEHVEFVGVVRLENPLCQAFEARKCPAVDFQQVSRSNHVGCRVEVMNVAENVALLSGKPVAVFSMEMPGESLAMRMMSSLGRINQTRVRTGKLEDDEWPRLTSAVSMLAETKFYIDDTPALSPLEVRARARRLMREHGELGLIMLDYLQLMQVPGMGDNRTNEISNISRSLKALAKELNVPVIALSQLNRSLEQMTNKRPIMSDLRESGAIEQDADLVVFIYRDEVYNADSTEKGVAEIIIGKQRNGPIGTVRLTFLGEYTKFENYAHDVYGDSGY